MLTSSGGGLGIEMVSMRIGQTLVDKLRPGPIDANDAAFEQAIRISVLNIGNVPPYFLDPREHGGGQTEPREEKYRRKK